METTPAYPAPSPTATPSCYLENNAPCGKKFYLLWTDTINLQTYSQTGHKNRKGVTTLKEHESLKHLAAYVTKQIETRTSRAGPKKFSKATIPQKQKREKKKRKRGGREGGAAVDGESELLGEEEDDIEPEEGFSVTLLLDQEKPRFYKIVWSGDRTGMLSYGYVGSTGAQVMLHHPLSICTIALVLFFLYLPNQIVPKTTYILRTQSM